MRKKSKSKRASTKHLRLLVSSLVGAGILTVLLVFSFFKPQPCANSQSCISDLSGYYDNSREGTFLGRAVQSPEFTHSVPPVLGDSTNASKKRLYIDLTNQRIYAFDGNTLVYNFPVSTGKWSATPTGDFRIWIKLRYTRMSGGSGSGYYNLPNVPYTMFFYNDRYSKSMGYGVHGAYWHNNFGHPMSHGCVNMREEDVAKIYYWADPPTEGYSQQASDTNPGTLITIYGVTPRE